MFFRFSALAVQEGAGGKGRDGAVGNGGGELMNAFGPAVPRHEKALGPGAAVLAGGGIAPGVQVHEVREGAVIRAVSVLTSHQTGQAQPAVRINKKEGLKAEAKVFPCLDIPELRRD